MPTSGLELDAEMDETSVVDLWVWIESAPGVREEMAGEEETDSKTLSSLESEVSAAAALVAVRRGSAGAAGIWSNGDVKRTEGEAASVALVLREDMEAASESCAASDIEEEVSIGRGSVAEGGAEEGGIGFKTDIPSVPNTLFVVFRRCPFTTAFALESGVGTEEDGSFSGTIKDERGFPAHHDPIQSPMLDLSCLCLLFVSFARFASLIVLTWVESSSTSAGGSSKFESREAGVGVDTSSCSNIGLNELVPDMARAIGTSSAIASLKDFVRD